MDNQEKTKERLAGEIDEIRSDMSQIDEAGIKSKDGLVESDENVQNFIEFAPYPIVLVNDKGKIVLANTQMESLFGYSFEELIGQSVEILLPERFRGGHIEKRNGYLGSPQSRSMGSGLELYASRKDGSEFPVDINLSPVSLGSRTLVMCVIIDITARKQDELDARERIISFSKHNPDPIIRLDRDEMIIEANPAAIRIFKDDQLKGKSWNSVTNGRCNIDCKKLIDEESSEQIEFEFDEKVYLLKLQSLPQYGFINMYGTDITNLKKTENVLQKNLERLATKTRFESIINSVSSSVHQSISLDEVLVNAVESLSANMDKVEFTAIFLVEGDNAVLKAQRGFPDWFVERTKKISKPRGFTWKTIIEGKSRYSPDTENDPDIGPAGREVGTKSYYSIPLRYGGEVIGSININSIEVNAFDEEELKLLDLVASQIEVAINNANQAQELLKKTRVETIISSITSSVHQSISLEEVLENAVESLINNLDKVELTGIFMVEGDYAVLKAERGSPDWFVDLTKKIPKPNGIIWKTILDGKPTYSPDTENDPNMGPSGVKAGIKSYYSIPLRYGGEVIGSININSSEKDAFDEDELKLLDLVGAQIEVAISNATQAQEREELIVELETKTAEMERFTYTVSHDLKSPLITIKGFLGMLERDIAKGHAERAKSDMEHISSAADKMQSLLDELLELSRVGRVVNDPQDVSLVEIVYEAVGICGGRIRDNGVKMDIASNLPIVYVDRQRYIEVFQNLIDNAVKFMGDQSEPRIEIGMLTDGENNVCYVRDNGIGIDSAYHEKVFSLFDTLDKDSEGTGIGLTIVKRIVELHGGTIRVESEGIGHGVTFYFTIPTTQGG